MVRNPLVGNILPGIITESIEDGQRQALDRGELLRALRAFKRGDFSLRMPNGLCGIDGALARAFNECAAASEALAEAQAPQADACTAVRTGVARGQS